MMLKKFLKDVINLVVGKNAEEVVELLHTNRHVNEFIISKKLDLTINQTRNILYKISNYGLVSSIRKKDKKKGWYTYFWKLEILKCLEFLKEDLNKKIEQFENQMKSRESKRFYVCETCNIEMTEERALMHDFTCNECGSIFVLKDSSKVLKDLKRTLDKMYKERELVEEEIKIEKDKLESIRLKEIKKLEKEKKRDREKKAKARKKLKEKILKSKVKPKKKQKKSVKKKTVSKKKSKKSTTKKKK